MTNYIKTLFLLLNLASISITFQACSGLGEKVEESNVEVYYTKNVSKEEAQKVAKFLNKMVATGGGIKQTTQLDKEEANYILKMIVIENFEQDDQSVMTAKTISYKLSKEVFADKPVRFWACHDGFVLQKDLGSYHLFMHEMGEAMYSTNVTKEELEMLLKGLKEEKIIAKNQNNTIEFDKQNNTYQLKLSLSPDFRENEKLVKSLQDVVQKVVNTYFAKKSFELHLCNQYFGTKKVIQIVSK